MNPDSRNLKQHMHMHTDEKPHKFKFCGKSFRFWVQRDIKTIAVRRTPNFFLVPRVFPITSAIILLTELLKHM